MENVKLNARPVLPCNLAEKLKKLREEGIFYNNIYTAAIKLLLNTPGEMKKLFDERDKRLEESAKKKAANNLEFVRNKRRKEKEKRLTEKK